MKYPTDLLKDLIAAESTCDKGELKAARVIAKWLARHGLKADIDQWDGNRANAVAEIGAGKSQPVIFAFHLDVVPAGKGQWKYSPFEPSEHNGRIYGRGAVDMKGPTAAVLWALAELLEEGFCPDRELIFAFVAGEETDSCGAKRFVEKYAQQAKEPAGVIIPEPTGFEVITSHRGILWLNLETTGKTAHGSTPQQGINAITSMRRLLSEIESYQLPGSHSVLGQGSLSINTISGGQAVNVVPDHCTASIDIRTLPGQNHQDILDDIRRMFRRLQKHWPEFSADANVIRSVPALETDNHSQFVKNFCSTVGAEKPKGIGFTTDGPFFAQLNCPVIIFGPGKAGLCHKGDEYIEITELQKAINIYKNIIKAIA